MITATILSASGAMSWLDAIPLIVVEITGLISAIIASYVKIKNKILNDKNEAEEDLQNELEQDIEAITQAKAIANQEDVALLAYLEDKHKTKTQRLKTLKTKRQKHARR